MPPKALRTQLKGKTKSDTNTASTATPTKSGQKPAGKAKQTGNDTKQGSTAPTVRLSEEDADLAGLDANALARIEEELQRLSAASSTGLLESDPTKILDAPVAFSQDDLDEIRRYEESLSSWRVQRPDQRPADNVLADEDDDDGSSSEDGEKEEQDPSGAALARPESAHRRLLQQHATKTTATTRPSSAGRLGGGGGGAAPAESAAAGDVPSVQGLGAITAGANAAPTSGRTSARLSTGRQFGAGAVSTGFTFGQLVKMVLPPEVAHQDSTAVADALLEVTSARLDDVGMENTDCLECLTNVVHLHLQRNRIQSLAGLDFMLNLKVLLLRGNQITSISDGVLTLLPITHLDLAENNLEGPLDKEVVPYLPFETLTSLALEDNPCTVSKSKAKDRNHPKTLVYRNAVLCKTPFLEVLDTLEVSQEEKIMNDMNDPYDESDEDDRAQTGPARPLDNKTAGGDQVDNSEEARAADLSRIIAKHEDPEYTARELKDSDFGIGAGAEDEDLDDDLGPSTTTAGDRKAADVLNVSDTPGDGDLAEDDSAAVFRPTSASTGSKPSTPATAGGGVSAVPKKKPVSQSVIAGGVVSRAQQMQEALLKRYKDQINKKSAATKTAQEYQGEDEHYEPGEAGADTEAERGEEGEEGVPSRFQPRPTTASNRAEDSQEKLQQACGEQQSLRDELRQLGTHHSRVATSQISEMYNNATASLDGWRERAQERRRQSLYENADVPSAAYERALDALRQQAGSSDLDQFRKTKQKQQADVERTTEQKDAEEKS